MTLDESWMKKEIANGVEPKSSGLYQWSIERVGAYIGHSVNLDTVAQKYKNNVERYLAGLEYHNKGRDFRPIHRALAKAAKDNRKIILTLLENVEAKADRELRKIELISELRAELEPQGLEVLNGRE